MPTWQCVFAIACGLLLLGSATDGFNVVDEFVWKNANTRNNAVAPIPFAVTPDRIVFVKLAMDPDLLAASGARDTRLVFSLRAKITPSEFSGQEYGLRYEPLSAEGSYPYTFGANARTISLNQPGLPLESFGGTISIRLPMVFDDSVYDSLWLEEAWVAMQMIVRPEINSQPYDNYIEMNPTGSNPATDLMLQRTRPVNVARVFTTETVLFTPVQRVDTYGQDAAQYDEFSVTWPSDTNGGVSRNIVVFQFDHGQMPVGARGFVFSIDIASLSPPPDSATGSGYYYYSLLALESDDREPFTALDNMIIETHECTPFPLYQHVNTPDELTPWCTDRAFDEYVYTGVISSPGPLTVRVIVPWNSALPLMVALVLRGGPLDPDTYTATVEFDTDSVHLEWIMLDTESVTGTGVHKVMAMRYEQTGSGDTFTALDMHPVFTTGAELDFRQPFYGTEGLMNDAYPIVLADSTSQTAIFAQAQMPPLVGRFSSVMVEADVTGTGSIYPGDGNDVHVGFLTGDNCRLDGVYLANGTVWGNGSLAISQGVSVVDTGTSPGIELTCVFVGSSPWNVSRDNSQHTVARVFADWTYNNVTSAWLMMVKDTRQQSLNSSVVSPQFTPAIYFLSNVTVSPVYNAGVNTIIFSSPEELQSAPDDDGLMPVDIPTAGSIFDDSNQFEAGGFVITAMDSLSLATVEGAGIYSAQLVCDAITNQATTIAANAITFFDDYVADTFIQQLVLLLKRADAEGSAQDDDMSIGPTERCAYPQYGEPSSTDSVFDVRVTANQADWTTGIRAMVIRSTHPLTGCIWSGAGTTGLRLRVSGLTLFRSDDFGTATVQTGPSHINKRVTQIFEEHSPGSQVQLITNRDVATFEIDDAIDTPLYAPINGLYGWNTARIKLRVEFGSPAIGAYAIAVSATGFADPADSCVMSNTCPGTVLAILTRTDNTSSVTLEVDIPRAGLLETYSNGGDTGTTFSHVHVRYVSGPLAIVDGLCQARNLCGETGSQYTGVPLFLDGDTTQYSACFCDLTCTDNGDCCSDRTQACADPVDLSAKLMPEPISVQSAELEYETVQRLWAPVGEIDPAILSAAIVHATNSVEMLEDLGLLFFGGTGFNTLNGVSIVCKHGAAGSSPTVTFELATSLQDSISRQYTVTVSFIRDSDNLTNVNMPPCYLPGVGCMVASSTIIGFDGTSEWVLVSIPLPGYTHIDDGERYTIAVAVSRPHTGGVPVNVYMRLLPSFVTTTPTPTEPPTDAPSASSSGTLPSTQPTAASSVSNTGSSSSAATGSSSQDLPSTQSTAASSQPSTPTEPPTDAPQTSSLLSTSTVSRSSSSAYIPSTFPDSAEGSYYIAFRSVRAMQIVSNVVQPLPTFRAGMFIGDIFIYHFIVRPGSAVAQGDWKIALSFDGDVIVGDGDEIIESGSSDDSLELRFWALTDPACVLADSCEEETVGWSTNNVAALAPPDSDGYRVMPDQTVEMPSGFMSGDVYIVMRVEAPGLHRLVPPSLVLKMPVSHADDEWAPTSDTTVTFANLNRIKLVTETIPPTDWSVSSSNYGNLVLNATSIMAFPLEQLVGGSTAALAFPGATDITIRIAVSATNKKMTLPLLMCMQENGQQFVGQLFPIAAPYLGCACYTFATVRYADPHVLIQGSLTCDPERLLRPTLYLSPITAFSGHLLETASPFFSTPIEVAFPGSEATIQLVRREPVSSTPHTTPPSSQASTPHTTSPSSSASLLSTQSTAASSQPSTASSSSGATGSSSTQGSLGTRSTEGTVPLHPTADAGDDLVYTAPKPGKAGIITAAVITVAAAGVLAAALAMRLRAPNPYTLIQSQNGE